MPFSENINEQHLVLQPKLSEKSHQNMFEIKSFSTLHDPVSQIAELTKSICINFFPESALKHNFIPYDVENHIINDLKEILIETRLHDTNYPLITKSRLSRTALNNIIFGLSKNKIAGPEVITQLEPFIRMTHRYGDKLINISGSEGVLMCDKIPIKPIISLTEVEEVSRKHTCWNRPFNPYFGLFESRKDLLIKLSKNDPFNNGFFPSIFFYPNKHESTLQCIIGKGLGLGFAFAFCGAMTLNGISIDEFIERGYTYPKPLNIPYVLLVEILEGYKFNQFLIQINTLDFENINIQRNILWDSKKIGLFTFDPINREHFKNKQRVHKRNIAIFNHQNILKDFNNQGMKQMLRALKFALHYR